MVFSNNLLMGAAGQATGYEIEQSIRFDNVNGVDAGGAQMFRLALTGTPTNTKKATISAWVKRATLGFNQTIAYAGDPNGSTTESIRFDTADTLSFQQASSDYVLTTTQVFRDIGAWYHIVAEIDTANGTAADRANLYVNGTKVTSFSTESYPTQDYVTNWTASSSSIAHTWGTNGIPSAGPSSQLFAGYMAEMFVLDGEKAGASSFGETNNDGVWVPIKYSGSFGNNGYYMTGETASALGDDFSGNSLDFTTVDLATTDQMSDTPTNNQSTLNPLFSGVTLSDGNLVTTGSDNNYRRAFSTIAIDDGGKYACEFQKSSGTFGLVGIMQNGNHTSTTGNSNMYGINLGNGEVFKGNPTASILTTLTAPANSLIRIEYDGSNDTIKIFDDGTEIFPASTGVSNTVGLTGQNSLHFGCAPYASGTIITATFSPLSGTPTATFKELTSANLATPTITDGSKYFQTTLYNGTGSELEVDQSGNSTFQPDFAWIKNRSNAGNEHDLYDAVRGATKVIFSSTTQAESTQTQGLKSFDSDGFTVGTRGEVNTSGSTNVAWQWLANNTTGSTNDDGSVDSTVAVNTTAGFSICKFNPGGNSNVTFGHGLGVAPRMVIVKNLEDATNWQVLHLDQGVGNKLFLNSSNAVASDANMWQNTAPTSTVVSVGTAQTSNEQCIAYCFAEIPAYSSIRSYVGNGSADGPYVSCDFAPAWVMGKRINGSGGHFDWWLFDAKRPGFNVTNARIHPNNNSAEDTGAGSLDLVSNGFKIRTNTSSMNNSGDTFIYIAFAENPFGGDGIAPATAR